MLSVRRIAPLLACTAAAAMTSTSHAELSANLGLVTEYLRDGISETRGEYAAQLGATYIHNSGLYGGIWASELKRNDDHTHSEWDLFAGYSRPISHHWGIDLGVMRNTFHGDWESSEQSYGEGFLRATYKQAWVLGVRQTNNFMGSEFARRVLEASYTLHTSNFDFEFYTARHRYLGFDDDYNFGSDYRDDYWHFRVGVERTYKQYDYRLTLERTNLTSDYDAGTTFQFGIHRYFDLW